MLSYGERLLRSYVKRCFPKKQAVYNCRTAGIINPDTGSALELDIYFSDLNLAFEFHGRQHKTDVEQRRRDAFKRASCKKKGITLLEIWTATLTQDIDKLILEKRPELEIAKLGFKFRSAFREKAENYQKNIYKMNQTLKSATFVKRRKK
jgi:hypothetical protein